MGFGPRWEIHSEGEVHNQLRDREDILMWDSDLGGRHTPKVGYLKLSSDGFQRVLIWWWEILWKIKSPPKTKIFMWCVLENKAPTWDNLQR